MKESGQDQEPLSTKGKVAIAASGLVLLGVAATPDIARRFYSSPCDTPSPQQCFSESQPGQPPFPVTPFPERTNQNRWYSTLRLPGLPGLGNTPPFDSLLCQRVRTAQAALAASSESPHLNREFHNAVDAIGGVRAAQASCLRRNRGDR